MQIFGKPYNNPFHSFHALLPKGLGLF
jgi:hypothetical protein